MEPIRISLVTAPGCHYCDDACRILESLKKSYPMAVDLVPMASKAGRDLVALYRVPFPPVLLINGSFFGHGRISRRKLERWLEKLEMAGRAVL
jgi:hypothetical protein